MSAQHKALSIAVEDYTTPAPITVTSDTPVTKVIGLMEENGIRHVPVVDSGEASGIISDRDLRIVAAIGNVADLLAKDIMTTNPFSVKSSDTLESVAFTMSEKKIGSAMVYDGKEFLGIFTSTDALNALIEVVRGDYED